MPSSAPTVESNTNDKPAPDLGELARNYVFQHFGLAGLIALAVIVALVGWLLPEGKVVRKRIGRFYSNPFPKKLPHADPNRLAVAVAELYNDKHNSVGRMLSEALFNLSKDLGFQPLKFARMIPIGDQPETSEEAGHALAQRYLRESGAHLLIWGEVTDKEKDLARLFWTPRNQKGDLSRKEYRAESFELPGAQFDDLINMLGIIVARQLMQFSDDAGRVIAPKLRSFIDNVHRLLSSSANGRWDPGTRARVQATLAGALWFYGVQTGQAEPLEKSIELYRAALADTDHPIERARIEHNLGSSLSRLGAQRGDTNLLREAIAALSEAAEVLASQKPSELLEDPKPSEDVASLINLGDARRTLGEIESKNRLAEDLSERATATAIAEFKEALNCFDKALTHISRQSSPAEWAVARNDRGITLKGLAMLEWLLEQKQPSIQPPAPNSSWIAHFDEAIASHRAARDVFNMESTPLYRIQSMNYLGDALSLKGECESDPTPIEEAIGIYHSLLEYFDNDPALAQHAAGDWADIKCNLAIVQLRLIRIRKDPVALPNVLLLIADSWRFYNQHSPGYASHAIEVMRQALGAFVTYDDVGCRRWCSDHFALLQQMNLVQPNAGSN